MGREQSLRLRITVTGGTGTGTVTSVWDVARWVRVCPVNETDTFNLTIKDADGNVMVVRNSITGTYAEKLEMSLGIMKTIVVTAASADGTYTTCFDIH